MLLADPEGSTALLAGTSTRAPASVFAGLVGEAVAAGEDGVSGSASDGRFGPATGDRDGHSVGILGGTALIRMPRGRRTATRIIGTTVRRTGPMCRTTTIRLEAI